MSLESLELSFRERESVYDQCGIIGAFSPRDIQFLETGLDGLRKIQTRGYDGAGFVSLNSLGEPDQHKDEGMVLDVFNPSVVDEYKKTSANLWVFQTRYGTKGAFNSENVQPFLGENFASSEKFIVAHNGQFSEKLDEESEKSDTLLFVEELAASSCINWEDRIVNTLNGKSGAWSLIIGTRNAMYLARDPRGIRPLVYGRKRNGTWVAASETSALEDMGINCFFEVAPGSVLKIDDSGVNTIVKSVIYENNQAVCIFENVYTSDSRTRIHVPFKNETEINSNPTIETVRYISGEILAEEAPIASDEADIVIGVPGTGIPGGKGFARACGIEYVQAITDKDPGNDQRTFMSADIDAIYDRALKHFNFVAGKLGGKRVVLVDDSIVRGNISKALIKLLTEVYGVLGVHLRVLSPAIDKPCHLGINTRRRGELIVARMDGNIEAIQRDLKADSLAYLSDRGLREAITGNPNAEGFCMGCMAGFHPPIDQYGKAVEIALQY